MSVETVKDRLALIQAEITGVKRAYAQAPRSLPAADVPAFVTFTGSASHNWIVTGSDTDSETRKYTMRLHVAPMQQSAPGDVESLCEPFFSRVRDAFSARPGLEHPETNAHLAGVQSAIITGDGGVSVFGYANVMYFGIDFEIEVTELVEVNYANYS